MQKILIFEVPPSPPPCVRGPPKSDDVRPEEREGDGDQGGEAHTGDAEASGERLDTLRMRKI